MQKVTITQNFVIPQLQIINKNQDSTQLILIDTEQSKLYLLHQYYCPNSNDYRQLITLLQNQAIQGNETPYVLNPVIYLPIKFTNQQMQTSHFVQVVYEYGSHTLSQQLYLRIQQKNYFQQHQIWSILGSCILGLKHLKQKQLWHNSVCLNDIFVTQQGNIKLCHPMFRTYDHEKSLYIEETYIERAISQGYFFSPQQIIHDKIFEKSRIKKTEQFYFKSDIFSLAVAVLSLCRLKTLSEFYIQIKIRNSYQIYIDSQKIQEQFNVVSQFYSQNLLMLLQRMLSYDPQERMSIDQLSEIITGLIQAKQKQQQEQQQKDQLNVNIHPLSEIQNSKSNSKHQIYSNTKLSRVSKASQLSVRSHKNMKNSFSNYENQPDQQDKPSSSPFQCQKDLQNADIISIQQQYLNESNFMNQTLQNYINNDDNTEKNQIVNHTLQSNKAEQQIKSHSKYPKQVQSIMMTSKNLGTLSDDTSSIVMERHFLNNHHFQENKQNIQNQTNIIQGNFKLNLNQIQQKNKNNENKNINFIYHKIQVEPQVPQIQMNSARNYNQKLKFQYSNSQQKKVIFTHMNNQNRYTFNQKKCPYVPILVEPQFSARTIQQHSRNQSLDRNFNQYKQNNIQNIYTDPILLKEIREDMQKIMKKRGMTVTVKKTSLQQNKKNICNSGRQKQDIQNINFNNNNLAIKFQNIIIGPSHQTQIIQKIR